MGEFSSHFDDDKDLDTSLSREDKLSSLWPKKENENESNSNTTSQTNEFEFSNHKSKTTETDAMVEETSYDNDLAALLSQTSFPTDEEIASWRGMVRTMEEAQKEEEDRDNEDLQRSERLGHFTNKQSIGVGTDSSSQTETIGEEEEESHPMVDIGDVDIEVNNPLERLTSGTRIVEMFTKRLQESLQAMNQKDKRRYMAEKSRMKDDKIVSKFTNEEPTTLSMRFFEDMDLGKLTLVGCRHLNGSY